MRFISRAMSYFPRLFAGEVPAKRGKGASTGGAPLPGFAGTPPVNGGRKTRLFVVGAALFTFATPAMAATVEEALLDALIQKGAPGDGAVSIVGQAPAGLDPAALNIAKLDYDVQSGRFIATLTLPTGRTFGLQGKVEAGFDVPVLTRPVQPGEIIASDDLTFVRLPQSRLPKGALTNANDMVGFSAKRQLRAGTALRDSDFQKPVVVKKGDAVMMVFRMPGIELTSRGKSMTDGGLGDTIAVVNSQSHKQVDAVVTGAGAVTVSPQNVALN